MSGLGGPLPGNSINLASRVLAMVEPDRLEQNDGIRLVQTEPDEPDPDSSLAKPPPRLFIYPQFLKK